MNTPNQKQSQLETITGKTYMGKDKETGYQVYQDEEFLYWYEHVDNRFRLKGIAQLNEHDITR